MSVARPWIDPANPPLPTPLNLPFHLSPGGSHISILIIESDDGLRSSWTRQCAGMMAGAGGGPPARGGFGGGGEGGRGGRRGGARGRVLLPLPRGAQACQPVRPERRARRRGPVRRRERAPDLLRPFPRS